MFALELGKSSDLIISCNAYHSLIDFKQTSFAFVRKITMDHSTLYVCVNFKCSWDNQPEFSTSNEQEVTNSTVDH